MVADAPQWYQDQEEGGPIVAQPAAIRPVGRSKHVRICVHSDPGAGKSGFAGTSEGKVLLLRPPFEYVDSIHAAGATTAQEWIINDWDEMNEALDYLRHDGAEWDW